MVIGEYTLAQAIVTVLDNAADASPLAVTLKALWNSNTITLQITDAGGGIDPAILASLGDLGISGKPDGLGMGLYLARAVITRLEGSLQMTATECGTEVILTLPCKTVCP